MAILLTLPVVLTQPLSQPTIRIDPVVVASEGEGPRSCPSGDIQESGRRNASAAVRDALLPLHCGGLNWTRVVSLDFGDPTQQCPSPWVESFAPARTCTNSPTNVCLGPSFSMSGVTYSRVCGRAVGYTDNLLGGFSDIPRYRTITDPLPYIDGVSVTHGSQPLKHIWSFVASHAPGSRCPCDNAGSPSPPAFVEGNYFCDSESNGALWDGQNCTTACCTFNSPPWFTVTLPAPTSDDIAVRICTDQHAERVYLRLIQIFVQ